MLGAILGDIIGSPYQLNRRSVRSADFPLFVPHSIFTDDTILITAVTEGLMRGYNDPLRTEEEVRTALLKYGHLYPRSGYGRRFGYWLNAEDPKPYHSCGSGSAIRAAAAGWLYPALVDAELFAEISAKVTHNHEEGLKGASAIAAAVCMARSGHEKKDILSSLETEFGYRFQKSYRELCQEHRYDPTCLGAIPRAMTAFSEGSSYEEVVRMAVALGGDASANASIAGGLAEAYYGLPEPLKEEVLRRLPKRIKNVYYEYEGFLSYIL